MSQSFVAGFFPQVTSSFPRVFRFLFPDDVAENCPEVSVGTIRNPSLAAFALWGLAIGARGTYKYSSLGWWRIAFGCFGLMNLVALPLHCLVLGTPVGKSAVGDFPILWLLDCIFTGMSSFAIIGACLDKLLHSPRRLKGVTVTTCLSSAFFAVAIFYTSSVTIAVEIYYLLPLIVAGQVCFFTMLKNFRPGGTEIVVLGGLLAGAGILFDPFFCRFLKTTFYYDLFTTPALMFAGCDVSFVGLDMWIDEIYISWRKKVASSKPH